MTKFISKENLAVAWEQGIKPEIERKQDKLPDGEVGQVLTVGEDGLEWSEVESGESYGVLYANINVDGNYISVQSTKFVLNGQEYTENSIDYKGISYQLSRFLQDYVSTNEASLILQYDVYQNRVKINNGIVISNNVSTQTRLEFSTDHFYQNITFEEIDLLGNLTKMVRLVLTAYHYEDSDDGAEYAYASFSVLEVPYEPIVWKNFSWDGKSNTITCDTPFEYNEILNLNIGFRISSPGEAGENVYWVIPQISTLDWEDGTMHYVRAVINTGLNYWTIVGGGLYRDVISSLSISKFSGLVKNIKDSDSQYSIQQEFCEAKGISSFAEGRDTITNNLAEHAEGQYNKSNTNTLHSVGIGTSDTDRKNAHEIMTNGNHYVYGVGGYDGTNPAAAKTLQEMLNGKVNVWQGSQDAFDALQSKENDTMYLIEEEE